MLMLSGEELRFCNCAQCGKLLLGDRYKDWYKSLTRDERREHEPPVDARIGGRPYCHECCNRVN